MSDEMLTAEGILVTAGGKSSGALDLPGVT
jgi:hypothetical protein